MKGNETRPYCNCKESNEKYFNKEVKQYHPNRDIFRTVPTQAVKGLCVYCQHYVFFRKDFARNDKDMAEGITNE